MCSIDPYAIIHENLELACAADPARAALGRDALMALPRAWLLSRLDAVADPMLAAGDARVRGRLLDLYQALDADQLADLARRGAVGPDTGVATARDSSTSTR